MDEGKWREIMFGGDIKAIGPIDNAGVFKKVCFRDKECLPVDQLFNDLLMWNMPQEQRKQTPIHQINQTFQSLTLSSRASDHENYKLTIALNK